MAAKRSKLDGEDIFFIILIFVMFALVGLFFYVLFSGLISC